MAKGVVFNIPGYGHINPSLALVRELVDRGEQIDYYGTEEFQSVIEKTGARFLLLPPNELVNNNLENFHLLGVLADLVESTYRLLPTLLREVKAQQYDYVLTDLFALWGRLVADELDIPKIVCFPVFGTHPDFKEPPHSKLQLLRTPLRTVPNALRVQKYYSRLQKRYQLPVSNPEELIIGEQKGPCLVFTAKELQPQAHLFGPQYHFVGPSLSASVRERLPAFPYGRLESDRPIVYISLGSVLNHTRFYRQCIRAFNNTPYTVILNIGNRLSTNAFPAAPNVLVCNYAPQLEVLQRAALFITHGGMNSAQEGLYHQVPLLVVPQVSDQFLVADVVEKGGLGRWLPMRRVTPARLRQMAEALMHDGPTAAKLAEASQALQQAGGYQRAADIVQAQVQGNGNRLG